MEINKENLPLSTSDAFRRLSNDLHRLQRECEAFGLEMVGCLCERDVDSKLGTFFHAHCCYGRGEAMIDTLQMAIEKELAQ